MGGIDFASLSHVKAEINVIYFFPPTAPRTALLLQSRACIRSVHEAADVNEDIVS